MRSVPVVGIAGWSGSGKTTVLEYLLVRLTQHGLRVNLVKHSHHALAPDTPAKDSVRLRNAGAGSVVVSSSVSPWSVPDLGYAAEPVLDDVLNRLPPADLVLLEGFKKEPVPKLEIHRFASGNPALYPHDPNVVAIASDAAAPAGLAGRVWRNLHQPAQVLAWLQIFIDGGAFVRGYGYTTRSVTSPPQHTLF